MSYADHQTAMMVSVDTADLLATLLQYLGTTCLPSLDRCAAEFALQRDRRFISEANVSADSRS